MLLGLAFERARRRGTNQARPTAVRLTHPKQTRKFYPALVRLTTRRCGTMVPVRKEARSFHVPFEFYR